jgi:PAS domain S-box-containing protein
MQMEKTLIAAGKEPKGLYGPGIYQAALRAAEEKFTKVFGASPDALFISRQEDGCILEVNGGFERLLGYSRAEVCGRRVSELRLSYDRAARRHIRAELAAQGRVQDAELAIHTKSGELRQVSLTIEPMESHGQPCWLNILRDVTLHKEAEKAFYSSEGGTRALLEMMPAAMFTCDTEGLITYYNRRAAELWGRYPKLRDPDNRYCGSFRIYQTNGELLPHFQCPMAIAVTTGRGTRNEEIIFERPDGTTILASVNIDLLYDPSGRPCGAINVFEDVTARKEAEIAQARLLADLALEQAKLQQLTETLEERVRARSQQVRRLAAQLSLAEHRERDRIARILHDHVQQMLYAVKWRMDMMESDCAIDNPAHSHLGITELKQLADEALRSVRTLSVELSPPVLENEGLPEAVAWLASQVKELHALDVTIHTEGVCRIEDKHLRIVIFQIVRELLFNVVKHAQVEHASVTLCQSEGEFIATVSDQGQGFDPVAHSGNGYRPSGLGLAGIHEQLELFNGALEVYSSPSQGTRVRFTLPLA